jgi:cyclohexa-1,5-dienecarbonyl-CoA hydratase
MTEPLRTWFEAEGRLLRLRLNRPKANLIDGAMIAALENALNEHLENPNLAALLLDAEGPNFSFGASVEEHQPDQCAAMLRGLHRILLRLVESSVPVLVVARGQCLGGGLELALAGHLLFVAHDAKLGQPEIKLGVFAPAASCLLPELTDAAQAFDLLVSGRTIAGVQAATMGIAYVAAIDPEPVALDYFSEHLMPKSASSLRYAVKAARFDFAARVRAKIENVERMYLDDLMQTKDAIEGLQAYLEKRPAQWQHH